ncbi:MAG: lysine--tRNA ligase [Proteobacteria bacterium]|nr:lysine--tRNA ligase [Pseudomonadota bacterium]
MSDENHLITERRQKLSKIREQGIAFPNDFRRTHLAQELHDKYDEFEKPELADMQVEVSVVGRMMSKRIMGKASFSVIQDSSASIQLFVQRDVLPEGHYGTYKSWDIGDIIAATGVLFKTNTGELSVKIAEIRLLTKSLRPLPEKFHGLTDQETRYRQRYVDLIMNQVSRDTFKTRAKIITHIRTFMEQKSFMEVETPMMHLIPGGAAAKPFKTHHNALNLPLYLRIAPELFLKRLVVGGFERVYEINRNFRNEGVSSKHNPEFTMMEFYWAYADYNDLMDLTQELFQQLAEIATGSDIVEYQNYKLDFATSFERISMKNLIKKYNPEITEEDCASRDALATHCDRLNIHTQKNWGQGKLLTELFEATAEEKLIQPTFVTEYPTEISPLSRRNDENPNYTDRFELFIAGNEIANGFSELNDPEDQEQRFKEQVVNMQAGDDEAMHFDADYIRALEYGMPPTAGEGIGIDRLVMLFTNSASIRDVLLFPYMRPEV